MLQATGQLTASPAKALSAELEAYLKSAGQDGIVFVSMGTSSIPGLIMMLPCTFLCLHGTITRFTKE